MYYASSPCFILWQWDIALSLKALYVKWEDMYETGLGLMRLEWDCRLCRERGNTGTSYTLSCAWSPWLSFTRNWFKFSSQVTVHCSACISLSVTMHDCKWTTSFFRKSLITEYNPFVPVGRPHNQLSLFSIKTPLTPPSLPKQSSTSNPLNAASDPVLSSLAIHTVC